ncbi:MAG: GNAT family N-acetyltransferase [Acidimicrobiales bacterium]
MERVREAGPGDLARCAELLAEAGRDAAARRGGDMLLATGADAGAARPVIDPSTAVARWTAPDGPSKLLVGLFEEFAVGVAAGTVRAATGLVECCYVEPGARGVGVGGALTGELLAWFTRRGCTNVDAWALPGDRETKQLLEAAGFSARLLILHRRLP